MPGHCADRPLTWTLVVPVKVLARAKSRLAGLAGRRRPELALAMAMDTVAAALTCPLVAQVVVMTSDPDAGALLAGLGALVVPDDPGRGMNAALRAGAVLARSRWPRSGVGGLTADLPALRPAELALGLRAAGRSPQAFVPDTPGTGTTLYTARPAADFRPRFGPGSAARHRQAGATEITEPELDSLRRDVDAAADLWAAAELGLGAQTSGVAAALLPRRAGDLRCGRWGR